MSDNAALLEKFYQAFQKRDHQTMAACYHPMVRFRDPVFDGLEGWKASAMWRMLCERGKDLTLEFSDVSADEKSGKAFWEAHYTFSQSGLKVHNKIQANFLFEDGLIANHEDHFDLGRWMGMALGLKGKVLGFFPFGRKAVSAKAMAGLDAYIKNNGLGPSDFANGGNS